MTWSLGDRIDAPYFEPLHRSSCRLVRGLEYGPRRVAPPRFRTVGLRFEDSGAVPGGSIHGPEKLRSRLHKLRPVALVDAMMIQLVSADRAAKTMSTAEITDGLSILSDVAIPLIGAAVAFFAGLAVAGHQRRGQLRDARRKSYSVWFTSENLLYERVKSVCDKLVGFPRDRDKHAQLMSEVQALAGDMEALNRALHDAYLAESRARSRRKLRQITEHCSSLCGHLTFAGRHYRENLEFHEYFSETTPEERSKWSEELRLRWKREKERFEKHDAECPFKSDTFRLKVVDAIEKLHKAVMDFQESLAHETSK